MAVLYCQLAYPVFGSGVPTPVSCPDYLGEYQQSYRGPSVFGLDIFFNTTKNHLLLSFTYQDVRLTSRQTGSCVRRCTIINKLL